MLQLFNENIVFIVLFYKFYEVMQVTTLDSVLWAS